MRRIWRRILGGECTHDHTLVVSSVGVRRTVCRSCGHMSFTMAERRRSETPARPALRRVSGL